MASFLLTARSYYHVIVDRATCTKDTCPVSQSYYAYLPSLAANGAFLALFGLSLAIFLAQSVVSRRFKGFSIAVISGCIIEIIGYIGRVMSWYNPFRKAPYLMQIITLTIGPAFFAAAIYLTLSRIVMIFGKGTSRIKPLTYPLIFIPCDIISLILQAAGGGIASVASNKNKNPANGQHIMVAGLAFQVATLFVFICLCVDFGIRTYSQHRRFGADAFDERHEMLRKSKRFQGFLIALSFATLCIFTRCVYRVAELSEGWNGHLIHTQRYFIGLEGAIVSAAVLALNAFHPGFCFTEGDEVRRGAFGFGKRQDVDRPIETLSSVCSGEKELS